MHNLLESLILNPYFFTGLICCLTGYIPSVSTEIILISMGLVISKQQVLTLALIGAFSQTLAKCHLYFLSAKVVSCFRYKTKRKFISLKKRLKSRDKLSASLIFISALIGVPPYYFINLLCGLFNTGWIQFCMLGFIGMFIRFYCCLAFPNFIINLFGLVLH